MTVTLKTVVGSMCMTKGGTVQVRLGGLAWVFVWLRVCVLVCVDVLRACVSTAAVWVAIWFAENDACACITDGFHAIAIVFVPTVRGHSQSRLGRSVGMARFPNSGPEDTLCCRGACNLSGLHPGFGIHFPWFPWVLQFVAVVPMGRI